tara:strand:+ start:282443 stop:282628 length:186 start_codon:yes stop_codon:yes gene_type:complete
MKNVTATFSYNEICQLITSVDDRLADLKEHPYSRAEDRRKYKDLLNRLHDMRREAQQEDAD